jgi:hypothetical protein
MNFGALKQQVIRRLGRDDYAEAPLGDYINLAGERVSRSVRIPALEVATTTLVNAEGAIVLPGNIEFLRYVYDDELQLQPMTPDAFRRKVQTTGEPTHYIQVGQKLYLAPIPEAGRVIGITYFRADTPMVDDGDENILARAASDALIYGALYEAAVDFGDDKRAGLFSMEYDKRVSELTYRASEFYSALGPIYQSSYHQEL